MTTETGGPAFPCEGGNKFISGNEIRKTLPSSGMTLRDYLAAKAMQGYLANAWQAETLDSLGESSAQQMATVAEISYCMADAMLAARTK